MTDPAPAAPTGGYRRFTSDGTYWTVRKRGGYSEVVRLRTGTYEEVETWGAYNSAGAAAGAAAELAYQQGFQDAQEQLRGKLHDVLAGMGTGTGRCTRARSTTGEDGRTAPRRRARTISLPPRCHRAVGGSPATQGQDEPIMRQGK